MSEKRNPKPDEFDGELKELVAQEGEKITKEAAAQECKDYAEAIEALLKDPDAYGILGEMPIGYNKEKLEELANRFPKFHAAIELLSKLMKGGFDKYMPLEAAMEDLYRSYDKIRGKVS